jgi:hypothetical protein
MATYIPTGFLSILIGDTGTNDATPSPTKVGTELSSSILELQSTTRALTLTRMTTAQRNAIAYPLDGMVTYDSDFNDTFTRKNGAWVQSSPVSGVFYTSVTLSAAQVRAMRGAGVLILAAPGVGLAYVIHGYRLNYVRGDASFADGGNIYLEYGAAGGGTAITGTITAATLQAGASSSGFASGGFSDIALTNASNQVVSITNATGAFTSGGTSTVNVQVWYSTVSTLPA